MSLKSRNGEYRQTIFKDIYALGKRRNREGGGGRGWKGVRRGEEGNARMFKPCAFFYTSCESFIALGSPKYRGHAKLSISYIFNNTGHAKEKLIKLRLDKVLSDADTRQRAIIILHMYSRRYTCDILVRHFCPLIYIFATKVES